MPAEEETEWKMREKMIFKTHHNSFNLMKSERQCQKVAL